MSNSVSATDIPALPWETGGSKTSVESAAESLFSDAIPEGATDDLDESVADEADSESEVEGVGDSAVDSGDGTTQDGATDETETEDEDYDADEDSDEADDSDDEDRLFTVKVDGEEVQITEDELKAGYSRTATFTRRMQEVAEREKAIEARDAEINALRAQYVERIALFEEALKASQPAEPDWDRLREEDPAEYAAQMADWQRREQQLAVARAERQRLEAEAQADRERQLRKLLADEAKKLAEAIPEFADPEKAPVERNKLASYAKGTYGFSDEDLSNVYDHRVLVLLRKAMLWDELQSQTKPDALKKVKKKAKDPKVLKPGSPKPRDNHSGKAAKAHMDRLTRTGRVDDAAAALLNMPGLID